MIVCAGELMWDVHVEPGEPLETGTHLRKLPGGAAANVALGLARRGHAVAIAGVVSDDALGAGLCEALERSGVATSLVERRPGRTGLVFLERVAPASERFVSYRPTVGPFRSATLPPNLRALHIAALNPVLEELAGFADLASQAHGLGAWVSLDVNARPLPWREPLPPDARAALERLLAHVDVVKTSDADIAALGRTLDDPLGLLERSAQVVFVTRAAQATRASGRWGAFERAPLPVQLVRSIGAGDAFCEGMLAALVDLPPEVERARLGERSRELLDEAHRAAAARVGSMW